MKERQSNYKMSTFASDKASGELPGTGAVENMSERVGRGSLANRNIFLTFVGFCRSPKNIEKSEKVSNSSL